MNYRILLALSVAIVAVTTTSCKDERDEICALTWEEHGLGPADSVYAGQNGYDVADLDGNGFIIKPEFDYYCNITAGKTDAQLIDMFEMLEIAQSIGQP